MSSPSSHECRIKKPIHPHYHKTCSRCGKTFWDSHITPLCRDCRADMDEAGLLPVIVEKSLDREHSVMECGEDAQREQALRTLERISEEELKKNEDRGKKEGKPIERVVPRVPTAHDDDDTTRELHDLPVKLEEKYHHKVNGI